MVKKNCMLSKSAEYAIRALVYVWLQNLEGKRPGYREIAKEIDSPEQFTAKIMQTLTRFRLVYSAKGRGGGFYFDSPAGNLTIYQVIQAIDGEKFFTHCAFGFKSCSETNPCPLHGEFAQIRNNFEKMVHRETIQSLAEKILAGEAFMNRKMEQ